MTAVVLAPDTGRSRIVPAAGLVIGAACASAAVAVLPWAASTALIAWVGVALAAAVVDARIGRLPDIVVIPGLLVVLIGAAVSDRLLGAAAGAALFGIPLLVAHLTRPDGMGFGDVKFSAMLGAGIGLIAVPLVLPAYLFAAVLHTAVCSVIRAGGRLVPFGPSLAFGSILIVLLALVGRL